MEEKKICSKCSELKDRSEYYTILNKQNGHVYEYKYCKGCHYKATKPLRKVWMEKNPEKGKKLQISANKAWRLRGTPGIYLLETDKGTYIGQSRSIEYRMSEHYSENNIAGVFQMKGAKVISHTILEIVTQGKKQRNKREKYWIKFLRPTLNIVHHPDRNKKK